MIAFLQKCNQNVTLFEEQPKNQKYEQFMLKSNKIVSISAYVMVHAHIVLDIRAKQTVGAR